jgi:hypothetical protein
MGAAEKLAPPTSEPLTWAEICERYPDRWVCLVEIERRDRTKFEFRTARVIAHGRTRREPLELALPWWDHYDEIGHYFTGSQRFGFPHGPGAPRR